MEIDGTQNINLSLFHHVKSLLRIFNSLRIILIRDRSFFRFSSRLRVWFSSREMSYCLLNLAREVL